MRSRVLRAGTAAGVVAVLALPVTAQSATAAPTIPQATTASASARGRIVSGEALAAAVVVRAPSCVAPPAVHRRALGPGAPASSLVEPVAP